jgi:hypothetical protein
MNTKSKNMRLAAKIDLVFGVLLICLSGVFYIFMEHPAGASVFETYIIEFAMAIGGVMSFFSSPVLFILAKREEEKNPSAVEY